MASVDLQAIGNRISNRRKQLNYTQEILAEKMNVSVQMISNLERGNKAIKIENLIKLSEILDISADYILTGKTIDKDISTIFDKISKLNTTDFKMIDMMIDYCLNNR